MRKAGLTYNPYQIPTADGTLGPGIAAPPAVPDPQAMFRGMGAQQAPQQQQRQQTRLLYNPESRQYLVNNTLVDDNDIEYLKRTGEYLSEPITTEVPEGSWTPVTAGDIEQHITSLADLGIPELLSSGFQTVGAGLLRGTGRLGEQLGLPDQATDLLIGAGDAVDMSDRDQARFAEYYDRNNLFQNMLSAVPQGVASIGTSVGGALAGGKAGLLVGGPAGAAAGAFIGGIATILPMMVDSAYQSAVDLRGQDWADSPEGREEVVANAMMTTFVQAVPGSIAANHILKNLSKEVARNVVRTPGRLKTAGVVGLAEAAAESSAVLIERIAFDPDTRALFDQGDLRNLMPLVAERYGEEVAISAFAGGVLGGGVGALAGGSRLVRNEEGNKLRDGESTDLTKFSDEGQVGETTGPQFQGSGRQGVLPFEEFSSRDIENLSRDVGRESVLLEPPSTPVGFDRVEPTGADDSFERQGVLPFPFPESRQLAGPADTVAVSIPDPDIANQPRQNVIDFGVPISTSPAPEQTQSTPSPSTTPTPQTEQEQAAPFDQRRPTDGGKKDGGGFASQGAAKVQKNRVAKRMGVPAEELDLVETPEGWVFRHTKADLNENTEADLEFVGPTPGKLFRGVNSERLRYPGYFFTALRDYAATYTTNVDGPEGAVLETENVPQAPFDVTAVSEATDEARAAMFKRFEEFVAENYPDLDIETTQLNDVLRGEDMGDGSRMRRTDFAYPTDADIAFLREQGYDSAYFKQEGGQDVESYFLFDSPYADYAEEVRKALGLAPGEESVTTNQKKTGHSSAPEPEAEPAPTEKEVWDDYGLVEWSDLNDTQQNLWVEIVASGEANGQTAANILSGTAQGVSTAMSQAGFMENADAIEFLMQEALISPGNTDADAKALANKGMQEVFAAASNSTTAEKALVRAVVELFKPARTSKQVYNGMVKRDEAVLKVIDRNFPVVKAALEKTIGRSVNGNAKTETSVSEADEIDISPAVILAKTLDRMAMLGSRPSDNQLKTYLAKLKKEWQAVVAAGQESSPAHIKGTTLDEYFDDNGRPYIHPRTRRPTTREVTEEEAYSAEAQQRTDARRAAEDERAALSDLDEGNIEDAFGGYTPGIRGMGSDANYYRTDGTPITKPIERGKARMLIRQFVNKLRNKPIVGVYKNVQDFARRNPELYERAKASRPDLGTRPAAALSYDGNRIAIFTDAILTTQQLRFIMAHETLGHYGFRSIMPPRQFEQLMDKVYNGQDYVRYVVDRRIAAEIEGDPDSLSNDRRLRLQREFTEEYLADIAAVIDTHTLARVWSAVKTFIERLTGFKFEDYMARYVVHQARRYVRRGKTDFSVLTMGDVGRGVMRLESGEDPANMGRYVRDVRDIYAANQAAGLMEGGMGIPQSVAEFTQKMRNFGIDTKGKAETAIEQLFSLRTFRFRENRGAQLVFQAVTEGRNASMRVLNRTNEIMRDALDLKAFDKYAGRLTRAEYDEANRLLYDGMFYAINQFRAGMLKGPSLVYYDYATGEVEVNEAEIERLRNMGELSVEQMRDGLEYEVFLADVENQPTVPQKRVIKGIKGLTKDHPTYKAYKAARAGVANVWAEKIKADYQGLLRERDLNFRRIAERMEGDRLTPEDSLLLESITDRVMELYNANMTVDEHSGAVQYDQDSVDTANLLMENVNRALLNAEAAGNYGNPYDAVRDLMGGTGAGAIAKLRSMSSRLNVARVGDDGSVTPDGQDKFVVQNAVKDILMHQLQTSQSERLAKQSLVQGYTPIRRYGKFQMRLVARDEKGKIVRLDDNHKSMLAFKMFESESEALDVAKRVNEGLFTDGESPVVFDGVRAYHEGAGTKDDPSGFKPTRVTLEAVAEHAATEQAGPSHLNINEFMMGLRRFNIVLHPRKMNDVIIAMTKQNNSARNRLLREGNPGWDPDGIKAISEFAESMGSNIAKVLMRPKISEYMDMTMRSSQKLWNGDKDYLRELKQNYEKVAADPNATGGAVEAARHLYEDYAFQFYKTNPKDGIKRANMYRNEAASLLAFLDGNANFQESTFESGPIVSRLRGYTSMFQLGGSIATGTLTYIGAWLNGIPTLASRNSKTAFGGGFGFSNAVREFTRGMNQIGLRAATVDSRLNTGEFYDMMAQDDAEGARLRKKYRMTVDEAIFIRDEILEGVMIPAQSNALLGTTRGYIRAAFGRKAVDTWMWIFNQTEQASRRSLGLAAFRLEYARQKAALPENRTVQQDKEAWERARKFAVEMLDQTVGRYDVSNRPPVWRAGLPAMMYMYKVFPTTSIQMLKNLPRRAQIGFLLSLFFLSGIRGFPFAEDLEDMIDTIAQGLGLQWRGTRIEMAKAIDGVMPGVSPIFIRGVINQFSTGDVGIRTQLGDFVPGTGMFLAGANQFREISEIGGPMIGMMSALGETIPNAIRATTGIVTGNEKTTLNDVFRNSPITIMRAFGDAWAYNETGAIVDRRGYVISPDMHAGHILGRLMGWYPASAAQQYDVVQAATRLTNYQREITAGYRVAWIKAKMAGDDAKARRIVEDVNAWNEGARGTALEIRNFLRNSNRALRTAIQPAADRTIDRSPTAARQDMDMVVDLLTYNN